MQNEFILSCQIMCQFCVARVIYRSITDINCYVHPNFLVHSPKSTLIPYQYSGVNIHIHSWSAWILTIAFSSITKMSEIVDINFFLLANNDKVTGCHGPLIIVIDPLVSIKYVNRKDANNSIPPEYQPFPIEVEKMNDFLPRTVPAQYFIRQRLSAFEARP